MPASRGQGPRKFFVNWGGADLEKSRCLTIFVPKDVEFEQHIELDGHDGHIKSAEENGACERCIHVLKMARLGRVRIRGFYDLGGIVGRGMNGAVVKGRDETTRSWSTSKVSTGKEGPHVSIEFWKETLGLPKS